MAKLKLWELFNYIIQWIRALKSWYDQRKSNVFIIQYENWIQNLSLFIDMQDTYVK